MRIEAYLTEIGLTTADAMKFALYSILKGRHQKEQEPGFAGKLAAAVTNYLFEGDPNIASMSLLARSGMGDYESQRERLEFANRNLPLVESSVEGLREWADDNLCMALTCALYNFCYAKYIQGGGKVGFLSSNFLGYVRALQKHDY